MLIERSELPAARAAAAAVSEIGDRHGFDLWALIGATEVATVREKFLKGKLGLTDDDATLDAAIKEVATLMKADRTKSRATVYYLLAEKFGKLGIFA